MDYDSIAKGRRRNWKPLLPEEVRKEEAEARREAAREKRKGKKSTELGREEYRRRFREDSEERDQALWLRTKRQSIILLGGFLLLALGWSGFKLGMKSWRIRENREALSQVQSDLAGGATIADLSTPPFAFATWRSAWLTGDMRTAVSMLSATTFRAITKNRSRPEVMRQWADMYSRGAYESRIQLAQAFEKAEVLAIPSKPWSDGDLAVFRSAPYLRPKEMGEPHRYTLAFSYDSNSKQWLFADLRDADFFSVRWLSEKQIMPVKSGLNATRYNESGYPIN